MISECGPPRSGGAFPVIQSCVGGGGWRRGGGPGGGRRGGGKVLLMEYYNLCRNVLNILIDENRHRKNIIQVERDSACTRAAWHRPPPFSPLHWRIFAEMESHIDKATEAGIQSICRKGRLSRLSSHIRINTQSYRQKRKDPPAKTLATHWPKFLLSAWEERALSYLTSCCNSLVGKAAWPAPRRAVTVWLEKLHILTYQKLHLIEGKVPWKFFCLLSQLGRKHLSRLTNYQQTHLGSAHCSVLSAQVRHSV
jgi:hypothetical protein